MIGPTPICMFCKHYNKQAVTLSCAAFPEGIPEAILANHADHRRPYAGDHGVRFAPLDAAAAKYAKEMFGE